MAERRRDPDALLREIGQGEAQRERGRLKVFLGLAAGVGKTYAMLSEAHEHHRRGVDVVLGYVETHGRSETDALVVGIETLPRRRLEYRGVELEEFDVDAALARKPQLIVVDELAHSNVPGSRHAKRWQDVQELLSAGIDVDTALNVQHLESLNDAVAQITGVRVQETVPDSVIERADEVEVIDIPPEELRQRLREGKVYVPERIDHALEGFFRPTNLLALRELALRTAADRVDEQMRALRSTAPDAPVWHARDRILVCIAPSRQAGQLVRSTARMAAASHAQALAVHVESERQEGRSDAQKESARKALALAEQLGMTTLTLAGHDIVGEILACARSQNATLVVVGKPLRPRWKEILFGSVVDELIRRSGEIDVLVVSETGAPVDGPVRRPPSVPVRLGPIALIVGGCTAIAYGLDSLGAGDANLVMVLLLGVATVASRYGRTEATLSALGSVLLFNFLFVEPRFTFAVTDSQYLLTFSVMLGVALLISSLSLRLRATAASSGERERRTGALYSLTRALSQERSKAKLAEIAQREIENVFQLQVAVLGREGDDLKVLAPSRSGLESHPSEAAVARWVAQHALPAGRGTDTLSGSEALYLPLKAGPSATGVLCIQPTADGWPLSPAQQEFLEAFAGSLGLALERAALAKESNDARVAAESERLRNALLSSISHDLRTPLTSISGAASALLQRGGGELAETIYHESVRLNLQVQNLLDMTRLQSGQVEPRLEWQVLQEVVGASLTRCRELLGGRAVEVEVPGDLPLLKLDGELMGKLFDNLLENIAQHTPADTAVKIAATRQREMVRVIVADNGPGIPAGEEVAVFERFVRGGEPGKGLGLGLAICRTIARLHSARLWVRNGREGGAEFHLELPMPKDQPEVPVG